MTAQRKTLLVRLVAVGAFGTRGGVRPTEIEATAGAAAPLAMRKRNKLITGGGGTPTPCTMAAVIIRPQAEVEDELPVAFPARRSFEIADLTSEATGFDSDL